MTKRRGKRGSGLALSDFEASHSFLDSTCAPESFQLDPPREPDLEPEQEEKSSEPQPAASAPLEEEGKPVQKPKRKYNKKKSTVKVQKGLLSHFNRKKSLKFTLITIPGSD